MRLLQRPLAYPPLCCPSLPTRHFFSCRTDYASPLWSLLASQHLGPSSSTTATPLSPAAVALAVALHPSSILLILPFPMHHLQSARPCSRAFSFHRMTVTLAATAPLPNTRHSPIPAPSPAIAPRAASQAVAFRTILQLPHRSYLPRHRISHGHQRPMHPPLPQRRRSVTRRSLIRHFHARRFMCTINFRTISYSHLALPF